MTTHSSNPIAPPSIWIATSDRLPAPTDALILKQAFSNEAPKEVSDWLGMVRGWYMGKEVQALAFGHFHDVTLAPVVENGLELTAHLTYWAPWESSQL